MRCLQHVLWRGALALGLLVSGGTGAMLMPQPEAPVCEAATRQVHWIDADATATSAVEVVTVPVRSGVHLAEIRTRPNRQGAC